MEKLNLKPFNFIGIAVRTSNENAQANNDIGTLWDRFKQENIWEAIPNKLESEVYSMYTDYEGDHTKPYTTIIGCKVENLDTIPEGMTGKLLDGGAYVKITAKGDLTKGLIINEWHKIWAMDLDRTYTADFEVYGSKAQNPVDAAVDIFISVK